MLFVGRRPGVEAAAAGSPAAPTPEAGYRADIDGLRAVAVLAVVLGHVGMRGFRGGYIGVDIFFVISGYLITGILTRDLRAGTASVARFYRRRILRIFPALFAMVLLVTPIACILLLPVELMRYARALAAMTLFSSNVLFFLESGYFEPASAFRPLLHTWSLGVEEQFYIVWPLVLAGLGTARPARLKFALLAITAGSFAASAIAVALAPSAAFFLLPFRAWELSAGGLLALAEVRVARRWPRELLAVAGAAMIAVAVLVYDPGTPFPGIAAAVPAAGAVLIIATGAGGTTVSRALSWRPVVFIGLISYSLYLWHWPLIVFAKMGIIGADFGLRIQLQLIAGAILLGYLSWRFVETPFRKRGTPWRTRSILTAGAVTMAATLLLSATLLQLRGLPARFDARQRAIGLFLDLDGDRLYRRGTCFQVNSSRPVAAFCTHRRTGRPALLLIGDSHAAHLWPGLQAAAGGFEVLQATRTGCRPLLHQPPDNSCKRLTADLLRRQVTAIRPAVVLISGNWLDHDLPVMDQTFADPVIRTMDPIILGPSPIYTAALPRLLAFSSDASGYLPSTAIVSDVFARDRQVAAIAARHGLRYISLVSILCPPPSRQCRTLVGPNVPLYFDAGHLTPQGSKLVARALMPRVEAMLAARSAAIGDGAPTPDHRARP